MDAPPLHDDLKPLEFLLGRWEGEGVGGYPTITDFGYRQELILETDGRPRIRHLSRTWSLDDGRPLAMECGFWRPAGAEECELVLAHATGVIELHIGKITGTRVELATDVVARSASAKEVTAERRLYGRVGEELMYAIDVAAVGQPLSPHLSARLHRVD